MVHCLPIKLHQLQHDAFLIFEIIHLYKNYLVKKPDQNAFLTSSSDSRTAFYTGLCWTISIILSKIFELWIILLFAYYKKFWFYIILFEKIVGLALKFSDWKF